MKKVLLGIGGALVVGVLGLLAVASMQPDTMHIERSITVAATAGDVFPYVNNFDKWLTWNPWQKLDPAQKVTLSEKHEGVGASYEWQGNDDVGHGRMTILESVPDQKIVEKLEFIEPFESTATVTMTLTPAGEQTKLTWSYDSPNNLMSKTMFMFMDMDAMLGADFDRGLTNLKPMAEADAKTRMDAERAILAAAAAVNAGPADPVAADPAAAPPAPTP